MQDTDISVKLERGTFLFTLVAVSVAFALLLKPFFLSLIHI